MPSSDYYPPGAYLDPKAPYNELEEEDFDQQGCPDCRTGLLQREEEIIKLAHTTVTTVFYTCDYCGTTFAQGELEKLIGN